MANAITVNSTVRGREQFQGAFASDMWKVKATISDQDAVGATDIGRYSLTVPGVALGDIVVGLSITNDLSDGTDFATVTANVTAANTVVLSVSADVAEYAADDLNSAVVRLLIARPAW